MYSYYLDFTFIKTAAIAAILPATKQGATIAATLTVESE